MRIKLKFCNGCFEQKVIWSSRDNKKYCLYCFQRLFPAKPLIRSPLKKSNKPIRQVSANREEALKKYRKVRDKFLEENPICMYPNCTSTDVTCHHARGRTGSFLYNKNYLKSLCVYHHSLVEREPELAYKLQLSYKRLDNE